MSREHWDWNLIRPNINVTGNPIVVVSRVFVAVPRRSFWQRLRDAIRAFR